MKKRKSYDVKRNHAPSNLFLGLVLVLMYLPILFVVLYSFNESRISSVWSGFSLKWYQELFRDKDMFLALRNSIVLGVLSCLAASVIGTLGAIGFSKLDLKGKDMVEYISMLPIMIPEIILGMVFMVFFSLLAIPFGMVTLVIAHTTFCIPYIYMMVKARLVGMDKNLAEAARNLGANEWHVFFDITLPLLAPAIISGMFLSFAMSFDDVVISMFVTGVGTNTLPIKIYTRIRTGVTPEINALCAVMLSATVLLVSLSRLVGRIGKPTADPVQETER